MDRMNILVSTNDAYVMPLSVLLQSLFDTNDEAVDVHFMWSDISQENLDLIEGLVASHGGRFLPVHVDGSLFEGLPTKKYISHETYYRLLAAEVLPGDVDRVLWLDADMVVNGPIGDFYRTDFKGSAVVACPHGPAMRSVIREDCLEIGIAHPEQYFNAGVMLCNLAAWREMGIRNRIRTIAGEPRKLMFPGQDFTNLVFNGRVKTADWREYNCMIHSVEPEQLPELERSAKIIHYVGSVKPWNFTDIPFEGIWKRHYDNSPFAGKPLRRTSYARMKAVYERMQKGKGQA